MTHIDLDCNYNDSEVHRLQNTQYFKYDNFAYQRVKNIKQKQSYMMHKQYLILTAALLRFVLSPPSQWDVQSNGAENMRKYQLKIWAIKNLMYN